MEHVGDGGKAPPVQERSTGDLVKLLSEQVSVLVRDELKLAQLEMTRKGKQAGAGIGMLGGGGLVALYGVGCLLAAAIIALAGAVAAWLAALIVGAALLACAASGAAGQGPAAECHPAGPAGGRRQHQDRRGRDQGKGAAMTTSDMGADLRRGTPLRRTPHRTRPPPDAAAGDDTPGKGLAGRCGAGAAG